MNQYTVEISIKKNGKPYAAGRYTNFRATRETLSDALIEGISAVNADASQLQIERRIAKSKKSGC